MKKSVTLFLILAMAVSVSACSQKAASAPPQTSAPTASAASTKPEEQAVSAPVPAENGQKKKVTVEITPPEGWEPVTGSVLAVQYMKNTASFMVKEENFSGGTPDAVVDEALGIYKKSFANLAVQGSAESVTIDGKEAKKLTFTCEISKMKMKYLYVYVPVEGKTQVITFGDLADSFDSLSADYETILKNIKFKVQ